jgi:hypothetical protein
VTRRRRRLSLAGVVVAGLLSVGVGVLLLGPLRLVSHQRRCISGPLVDGRPPTWEYCSGDTSRRGLTWLHRTTGLAVRSHLHPR